MFSNTLRISSLFIVFASHITFPAMVHAAENAKLSIYSRTVNENAGYANVTIGLNPVSTSPVTVTVFTRPHDQAKPGEDYYGLTKKIVFQPGQSNANIRVQILDDELDESDESFSIRMVSAQGASLKRSVARVTIRDDDTADPFPVVYLTPVNATESDGKAILRVSLSYRYSQTVRVKVATANGTAAQGQDFYGFSQTVTFLPGQTAKEIPITILNDDLVEPEEQFTARLYAPEFVTIAQAITTVTISDDDEQAMASVLPPYMDDANRDIDSGDLGYPRVMFTESQAMGTPHARFGKYPIVAAQGSNLHSVEGLQATYDTPFLRMFTPRVYLDKQFDAYGACTQGISLPFEQSTPTTGNCGVWAGHWLYDVGTQLTASATANASQIQVGSSQGFKVGSYVAIYDGSLTSFTNAEHAKITAISGTTLTLSSRYQSTGRNRNAGAWVRQHAYDNKPTGFVYNLSTQSPADPSGQRIVDYMANWLLANLDRDMLGQARNVDIDGLLFDMDTYEDVFTTQSDTNNDLVPDGGVGPNGEQWWGDGLDEFYRILRTAQPDMMIVGGVGQSGGFDTLNGTQFEGFPNGELFTHVDNYHKLNRDMATYLYRMDRTVHKPAHVQLLMKNSTPAYPSSRVSDKGFAPMRLGLGLTAMDGGYFHVENSSSNQDTWHDEYAVITDPSDANYGHAVDKANTDLAKKNTGWLGQPVSEFYRLVDINAFSADKALLAADFESGTDGWSGNNVGITRTSVESQDGDAGLHVSQMQNYTRERWGSSVAGPIVDIKSGESYTLVFSARASTDRWINAVVGNYSERLLIGPKWRRYVIPFRATQSSSNKVRFQVGRESSEVYLDSVYVFSGNANVYRRDFENGTVIANATDSAVTITLESGYQRLRGTQDPAVNDGAALGTSVVVPARDALFAIKRQTLP